MTKGTFLLNFALGTLIAAVFVTILALLFGALNLFFPSKSAATPSASTTPSAQWLGTIHMSPSGYNSPRSVGKFCDTETGNLVYLYGDYRGGIAVVPGGCK